MEVSVLVPFAGLDPYRLEALGYITTHYEWEVVVGACEGPWRKAVAVQDAANRANGDLFVVADADCFSPGTPEAVQAVIDGAAWAMPHKKVHRLSRKATIDVLGGAMPHRHAPTDQPPYTGTFGGGIVVLTRDTWNRAPLDPRFVGWGQEDDSWAIALNGLAGPCVRLQHPLWHLWHPPQERMSRRIGSAESKALFAAYHAARNDPVTLARIVKEGRHAMPASHLMTQTATLHHVTETGTDEYNDATTSETTTSSPCLMQQTVRTEATTSGLVTSEVLVLFLPADADVDALSKVTVDGLTYELDGPPSKPFNPLAGAVGHLECTVRRVA